MGKSGKANRFLDVFFHSRFYKNKHTVFVRKSNNLLEKHYYDLSTDGKLLIYPENTPGWENNPVLKGEGITLDAKNKSTVLLWNEGSKVVHPIFNSEEVRPDRRLDSQYGMRLVNLGRRIEKLNNPIEQFQSKEKQIMVIIIIMLLITVVNIIFTYMIMDELGIQLLTT